MNEKELKIIIDGKEKIWNENEISYNEVIELVFTSYPSEHNVVYTVQYTEGPETHRQGTMVKGERVKVKTGMIFNVTKKHEKVYKIIVNAREKLWPKDEITYQEVVVLAYGSYSSDDNVVYSVSFSKGPESNHYGTMVKGDIVKVKNNEVFNVTQSNKS